MGDGHGGAIDARSFLTGTQRMALRSYERCPRTAAVRGEDDDVVSLVFVAVDLAHVTRCGAQDGYFLKYHAVKDSVFEPPI